VPAISKLGMTLFALQEISGTKAFLKDCPKKIKLNLDLTKQPIFFQMIAHSYIKENLNHLDRRYNNASSIKEANYCSKLAVLELCGWIELSMDDIVLRGCIRGIKSSAYRSQLEQKVKRNYGFEYQRHFVSILTALIGFRGLEKVEKGIPINTIAQFKSELGNLKTLRDSLAHTYFQRGVTVSYDAPSITISRHQNIAAGLVAYDQALRAYC
jgi:hypothetical protein